MTPMENGRHCDACDKIVIDFTSMTNDEILSYLSKNKSQQTCGYLNTVQISNKQNYISKKLLTTYQSIGKSDTIKPLKKSFLLLLSFLMILVGCDQRTSGKVEVERNTKDSSCSKSESKVDTSQGGIILGMIDIQIDSSDHTKK